MNKERKILLDTGTNNIKLLSFIKKKNKVISCKDTSLHTRQCTKQQFNKSNQNKSKIVLYITIILYR